jgi:hypothetical protein
MKTISGVMLGATAAFVLAAAPLDAQEDPRPRSTSSRAGTGVFGTLALGVASPGVGGVLSLSVHSSRNAFVVRSSGASEFTIFTPGDSVEDFAFLFGRMRERERGWLRAAIGPSLVRVTRHGNPHDCSWFFCSYDSEASFHAGLALQAEAVWTPADALGLGLMAFANANPEMSYVGLALGVHLGKVRRR